MTIDEESLHISQSTDDVVNPLPPQHHQPQLQQPVGGTRRSISVGGPVSNNISAASSVDIDENDTSNNKSRRQSSISIPVVTAATTTTTTTSTKPTTIETSPISGNNFRLPLKADSALIIPTTTTQKQQQQQQAQPPKLLHP